jgi:ribosomal protein S11
MNRTRRIARCFALAGCIVFFAAVAARCQTIGFSTIAGNAGYGTADGAGAAARFSLPQGVAADGAGNVYVADSQNDTIRRITPGGLVTTIAGLAGHRGAADGAGAAARFASPRGLAVDGWGNLYVADTLSHTIRMVVPGATNWQVITLAGQPGVPGTNDGTTNASFRSPGAIAVDQSTNLYVADTYNQTIRLITPVGTNWVVSTIAGSRGVAGNANGLGATASFSLPAGIAVDASSNLFVADMGNSEIREIAPTGTNWIVGTLAAVNFPAGIALNGSNSLVVADSSDDTVVTVSYGGVVGAMAGSGGFGSADGAGAGASFNNPQGTAVGPGGLIYVADSFNNTIRQITPEGGVSTLAGLAGGAGSTDGMNGFARFQMPAGVAVDAGGNVYVADAGNEVIRRVAPAGTNWVVTTIAGQAGIPGFLDGTGTAAQFNAPEAITVDSATNLYIADSGNDEIREMSPDGTNWNVTTLAGEVEIPGAADGESTNAQFNAPAGIALDGFGNLYVADAGNNEIRQVSPVGTNWMVTTVAGRPGFYFSATITNSLVVVSKGVTNAYTNISTVITNSSVAAASISYTNYSGTVTNITGAVSNVVFVVTNVPKVTTQIHGSNVVVTLAQVSVFTLPKFASQDGIGTNSLFLHPSGIVMGSSGVLYVADAGNSNVRQITTPANVVSTLAGLGGTFGAVDGTNGLARFYSPEAIAVDAQTNLYVADTLNDTVRRITQSGTNWVVTTVGGDAGVTGSSDGLGTNALFDEPGGLAMGAAGHLYVADTMNNTIRFGVLLPTLGFARSPNEIVLNWPLNYGDFVLQASGSVSPGAVWTTVGSGTQTPTNFVYTNSTAGPTMFFRLYRP